MHMLYIQAHKRFPRAQRPIFHTKSIRHNREQYNMHVLLQQYNYIIAKSNIIGSSTSFSSTYTFISLAYLNTKATTNKMANSRNSVTFTHPQTRQMQLAMPCLFFTTTSFSLLRLSVKLSILPTSLATSIVLAADCIYPLSYR